MTDYQKAREAAIRLQNVLGWFDELVGVGYTRSDEEWRLVVMIEKSSNKAIPDELDGYLVDVKITGRPILG